MREWRGPAARPSMRAGGSAGAAGLRAACMTLHVPEFGPWRRLQSANVASWVGGFECVQLQRCSPRGSERAPGLRVRGSPGQARKPGRQH